MNSQEILTRIEKKSAQLAAKRPFRLPLNDADTRNKIYEILLEGALIYAKRDAEELWREVKGK